MVTSELFKAADRTDMDDMLADGRRSRGKSTPAPEPKVSKVPKKKKKKKAEKSKKKGGKKTKKRSTSSSSSSVSVSSLNFVGWVIGKPFEGWACAFQERSRASYL